MCSKFSQRGRGLTGGDDEALFRTEHVHGFGNRNLDVLWISRSSERLRRHGPHGEAQL